MIVVISLNEARDLTASFKLHQERYLAVLLDFVMKGMRHEGLRQWGEVVWPDFRMGSYIGDMPLTWIGAGLMTAIRSLLVRETMDGSLVLFQGAPIAWFTEGNGLQIANLPTYYGSMDISACTNGRLLHVLLCGGYKVPNGICAALA